eukprot:COSAG02_NODE_8269_length_2636_cov_1.814348_1_plen_71_part_00
MVMYSLYCVCVLSRILRAGRRRGCVRHFSATTLLLKLERRLGHRGPHIPLRSRDHDYRLQFNTSATGDTS